MQDREPYHPQLAERPGLNVARISATLRHGWAGLLLAAPSVVVVAVCCGLPLAWIVMVLASNPGAWADLRLSGFRLELLARTLGYNALAAALATLMGLPAAFVLGRGRGLASRLMWLIAPGALLMPLLSFQYGWLQAFRLAQPVLREVGIAFVPGGTPDTVRCVWILACWLWGIPACIIGLHLRRMDPDLQLAASLHGATFRMTLRMLLGPIIASLAVVLIISTQEFAVYEPTGISVVATEARMVFSTGAFSALAPAAEGDHLSQSQRAAAAVMTAAPLLVVTGLLAAIASSTVRRLAVGESLHCDDWPSILDSRRRTITSAWAVVALSLGVPVVALIASLRSSGPPGQVLAELRPLALGSIGLGGLVAGLGFIIALSTSVLQSRWLLIVSVASFLLGGELLAIALIRLTNDPGLEWARDSCVVPVMAYVGRFGFIAVIAGRSTWGATWREYRIQAAVFGAGRWATAVRIVWPLAWPSLVAAAIAMGAFSLTEVGATATLVPQHPPVLTTQLLVWAHARRSDQMILGSLTALAAVVIPAGAALVLMAIVRRRAVDRAVGSSPTEGDSPRIDR